MTNAMGTLLVAPCHFGWGSLGKLHLILNALPPLNVIYYDKENIAFDDNNFCCEKHNILDAPIDHADVALVINDPKAADFIANTDIPVIYVDSLPFLWTQTNEIPLRQSVQYYCAQKYPSHSEPVSDVLIQSHDLTWIDAIVPKSNGIKENKGIVINVGGLHSHLSGASVDAYVDLVVKPTINSLLNANQTILGVCGNLSNKMCSELNEMLPAYAIVGPQKPSDFHKLLQQASSLFTSPGSTTLIQAAVLRLPTVILPPQNLSQFLNARIYSGPNTHILNWPNEVMNFNRVQSLRPNGEDIVLDYIYGAISNARQTEELNGIIRNQLSDGITQALSQQQGHIPLTNDIGTRGAQQVAQLVSQALLAPIPRPSTARLGTKI